MISVKRIESGKILHEVFDKEVNLLADGWQLHPSVNRFYIDSTEGALNITHDVFPAYMLRDLPEQAVMEMRNTYNPTTPDDVGGFVAYVMDEYKLELYEYYNEFLGTTLSFPYIRMIKVGESYEGYGSQDGENWDIRGAIDFPEANKWGIALEGVNGDNMKIHSISIYKDTKVYFKAVPKNGKVKLYDKSTMNLVGEGIEKDYEVEISVFNKAIPFEGVIEVYDESNTIVSQGEFEIWGGDVYHCGQFLEIYYNGQPLDLLNNDFGYIDSFYKDFKLELRNMLNAPHTNVNVEIKPFYDEFGYEWVEIAPDNDGVPGQFGKSIVIPEVPANGSVYFWLRIMRNSVPVHVDDYLFDFVINVW